jgi:hypothetical protein
MLTQSPNAQDSWESTCDLELTLGYFRSSGVGTEVQQRSKRLAFLALPWLPYNLLTNFKDCRDNLLGEFLLSQSGQNSKPGISP